MILLCNWLPFIWYLLYGKIQQDFDNLFVEFQVKVVGYYTANKSDGLSDCSAEPHRRR